MSELAASYIAGLASAAAFFAARSLAHLLIDWWAARYVRRERELWRRRTWRPRDG
jgi:hypothetical protein